MLLEVASLAENWLHLQLIGSVRKTNFDNAGYGVSTLTAAEAALAGPSSINLELFDHKSRPSNMFLTRSEYGEAYGSMIGRHYRPES